MKAKKRTWIPFIALILQSSAEDTAISDELISKEVHSLFRLSASSGFPNSRLERNKHFSQVAGDLMKTKLL